MSAAASPFVSTDAEPLEAVAAPGPSSSGSAASAASAAIPALLLLAACSGGGGGGGGADPGTPAPPTPPPAPLPPTDAEAARFLGQATFGASSAWIGTVKSRGYANFIDDQIAAASPGTHQASLENRLAQLRLTNATANLNTSHFYESFWTQAATAQDQLRQRVAFALSQIFVVSFTDPTVANEPRGVASYYDVLTAHALGNYRALMEAVALHPMMGVYLTHVANQKADPATGRKPDENFAREIMQLMSIGVTQLNADGTPKTDSAGAPIATYSATDISELAKVFTGLSWYSPTPTNNTFLGRNRDPDAAVRPLIAYPAFHSTEQKSFLGTVIPAGSTDAIAEVRQALDGIFAHPNVPPFVSKQLIQRLVTSNPTPGYVARVAAVFENAGGVRGNLAAVVKAILTDTEARGANAAQTAEFGKLREPVIRLANWMRAFGATSTSGAWSVGSTSANTSFNQSPMTAPSVFNFFRPGYSPPSTRVGAAGLLAPEFQLVDEITIAGYLNTLQSTINNGIGTSNDVRSTYAAETAIANDPGALVDRVGLLLTGGGMSAFLRGKIVEAVTAVNVPAATGTNQATIDAALLNRAKLAVFLTMASPEYLHQR